MGDRGRTVTISCKVSALEKAALEERYGSAYKGLRSGVRLALEKEDGMESETGSMGDFFGEDFQAPPEEFEPEPPVEEPIEEPAGEPVEDVSVQDRMWEALEKVPEPSEVARVEPINFLTPSEMSEPEPELEPEPEPEPELEPAAHVHERSERARTIVVKGKVTELWKCHCGALV